MSVHHIQTSIKDKPKTVEELTAQGNELAKKVEELEQGGGGGASPAMQAAVFAARLTMNDEIKAGKRTGTDVVECEALFEAWEPGKFEKGDVRIHDGQVWRCCQPHDNKNNPDIAPGKSPAQWVPYHTTNPAKAKPFIQPTMAEDSYQKGEVCLWTDGKVYRSILETANTYSPSAYPQGWEVVVIA